MHRIADLDLPLRLAGVAPAWVTKIACAILGVGLAVALRAVADQIAPGVAPYAFVYPAALFATLIGGWQAGAGTLAVSEWLAWRFVIPQAALYVQMRYQLTAAIIVGFTVAIVIAGGEGFRAAARRVVEERNAKLAERELLFRELQHRVANDFALVNGLLALQRRRTDDPETRDAFRQVMSRIQSVSRIHRHIYALPEIESVDLSLYLQDLCKGLIDSVLPAAGIELKCACAQSHSSREVALAVGLITNELITNSVKHAFPNGKEGHIDVRFEQTPEGWRLTVADDGVGFAPDARKAGLGTGLIEQFVHQAKGQFTLENAAGTRAILDLPAAAVRSAPGS